MANVLRYKEYSTGRKIREVIQMTFFHENVVKQYNSYAVACCTFVVFLLIA